MSNAEHPAGPTGREAALVSPLAVPFPQIAPIAGVDLAAGRAGFYPRERDDVAVLRFAEGTTCAGVFTRHNIGSAPVDWCKGALAATGGDGVRALIVNAGCANSFTGAAGAAAAERTAKAASAGIGCADNAVLVASTGVIGVVLDDRTLIAALRPTLARLTGEGWEAAARAMMTTDTFPKGAVAATRIGEAEIRIAGICKGSGMLAPDMATMLAFVCTDASLSPAVLKALLAPAVTRSLNAVTVDGDRSTNDTCLIFATGRAGNPRIDDPADPHLSGFKSALDGVLLDLAHQLARDGEGATKFVTVAVTSALSAASARKLARTVCESLLVKTAIAGEDANWGRIAAAIGRADEPIRRERLSIRFGPIWAAKDGAVAPGYDQTALSAYMKQAQIDIAIDVGVGDASAVMWTCDLTEQYVTINARYRS
jgi:glutamate N-acetyltransferase/amino-acid N-acetyltransferase